jgi:putative toxin-antitoxin system antitoxin component (TIGR02293 family)
MIARTSERRVNRPVKVSSVNHMVPVIAHAVAVFGDEHKASHWLKTPLQLIDNRTPSQLLTTAAGVKRVEQILTRIEHNIPS